MGKQRKEKVQRSGAEYQKGDKLPKLYGDVGSQDLHKDSPEKVKASGRQISGSHYKEMEIQPSEFISKNNISWYEGNCIKYVCRHKSKGGREDLEKAIHYLELAIEEYY